MNKEAKTYSVQVMDVANILFSNPGIELSSVASKIASKYNRSERTAWRYIKLAKEYNMNRIKKQEKAKDKVLVGEAKNEVKRNIMNRAEVLETLSGIIRGNARQINQTGELVIPTDSERIKAAQQLAKMQGWGSIIDDLST
ncbi:MAG: hypothetical protein LBQ73_07530 [Tannerellaceae bacterium]|jgi:predicted ATP-dependent protease|nr:hypothetical protein [Tannerellaceae bacterium]